MPNQRSRLPTLLAVIAVCAVVGVCLRLSWWQLERAEEKRVWLATQQERAAQPPVDLATLLRSNDPLHRVTRFAGQIDNAHPILLDNRTLNRVAGYYLLSPARTREGHWVLVNRGWVPRGANRETLPEIPPIDGTVTIQGSAYQPSGKVFVLEEETLPDNQWPMRVQKVDFAAIGEKLGVELAPFEIRVAPEQALGDQSPLPRPWQDVTPMGPERHKAYAMQWLGLAIAALVIFLFAATRAQRKIQQQGR